MIRAELERIKMENLRLRDMLNQVTSNYSALQMHIVTLMQDQKADNNNNNSNEQVHGGSGDVLSGKVEKKSNGLVVPRQFMDLGLAATNAVAATDNDEISLSSSEGRSRERSRSPPNNNNNNNNKNSENGNNEEGLVFDQDKKGFNRGIEREDSPDHQGWGPNKLARLNSSKNVDQTEATIRKARVSVRARSEAPMVQSI